jgi:hypothetical protein
LFVGEPKAVGGDDDVRGEDHFGPRTKARPFGAALNRWFTSALFSRSRRRHAAIFPCRRPFPGG